MKSFNQWNESFQNKEEKFIQIQKLLDQNKGNFRTRTNYLYRMLDCFSCCSHKMIGYIIKKEFIQQHSGFDGFLFFFFFNSSLIF